MNRAERLAYFAAFFSAISGWGGSHLIEELRATPVVQIVDDKTPATTTGLRTISFEAENLSRDKAIENVTLDVTLDPTKCDGGFEEKSLRYSVDGFGSVGSNPPDLQKLAVTTKVALLRPNETMLFKVDYKCSVDASPTVTFQSDEKTLRVLEAYSLEAWLIRFEVIGLIVLTLSGLIIPIFIVKKYGLN
jgi:hypothetical protein